jgi:transposase
MSLSSWLVAGIVPGVERQPLKKLAANEAALLRLLERWRGEAAKAGCAVQRVAVAFEAGRDGFWLARWLRAHDVEAHVIHPTSIAVSREHRRAKTDRLDTELLKRAFLGWLRGERGHCSMAAVPSLEEEDAKRPTREHESLVGERTRRGQPDQGQPHSSGPTRLQAHAAQGTGAAGSAAHAGGCRPATEHAGRAAARHGPLALRAQQIKQIEDDRTERIERAPGEGGNAMIRLLTQVVGVGVETADMLVHEVLSRNLRDRKAVARFAGLTGAPDESGAKRREQGLAKAGNARVRRGMIQLAWRFLLHQKDSALAQWYRARTADARPGTRKTLIVALARKLLIGLWRLVTTGEVLTGVVLRPAT